MQPHSPSADQPAPLSPTFFEFLTVRAGEHWFAVDVQATVEIRGPETFNTVGGEGLPMLTVREEELKVVDLRRLSGLRAFQSACPAMLLVQANTEVLALAVDEVGEIESAPRERVRAHHTLGYVFCSQSIAMADSGEIPLIDPLLLIAA